VILDQHSKYPEVDIANDVYFTITVLFVIDGQVECFVVVFIRGANCLK